MAEVRVKTKEPGNISKCKVETMEAGERFSFKLCLHRIHLHFYYKQKGNLHKSRRLKQRQFMTDEKVKFNIR